MSVRVRECESARVRECECESERVTFEPRHENKSCSACQDRVNERVKVANVVKVKVFQVFKFFKEFLVPRACLTFRHFFR